MRDPGCHNQNVSPIPPQQAQAAARIARDLAALGFAGQKNARRRNV